MRLLAVVSIVSFHACASHPQIIVKTGPQILTDANFEEMVEISSTRRYDWFVMFYAPWCHHCKLMARTWEALAARMDESGMDVKFAKVDCTAEPVLARRFNIRSFPSLLLLSQGVMKRHEGYRSEQTLFEFAMSGHEVVRSEEIPPAPSFWNRCWAKYSAAVSQNYVVMQLEKLMDDAAAKHKLIGNEFINYYVIAGGIGVLLASTVVALLVCVMDVVALTWRHCKRICILGFSGARGVEKRHEKSLSSGGRAAKKD